MNYSSGDAAKLAGLSQVRINQLFARSAASGGIPLGNLHSPSGAHRKYDHIETIILAIAAAVVDGPFGGPPMRDVIVALDDMRDAIEDVFVPKNSASYTAQELSDAAAMAQRNADRVGAEERSAFWTDRGADLWLALVVARYLPGAAAAIAGELTIFKKLHGGLLQIGAELANEESRLRSDPYAELHHVFMFDLNTIAEETARRANEHGIEFPPRRKRFGRIEGA